MRWRSKRLEKLNRKKEWHDFFCLLPRLIDADDGEKVWVWLEIIERKGFYSWRVFDHGWEFTYRLKNSK
jgi:hypothetical protein